VGIKFYSETNSKVQIHPTRPPIEQPIKGAEKKNDHIKVAENCTRHN
jgi:hypothetical protein